MKRKRKSEEGGRLLVASLPIMAPPLGLDRMRRCFVLVTLLAATLLPAKAAQFVVTTTADSNASPAGSLRRAIQDTQGLGDEVNDAIVFDLPGAGPHMIDLIASLFKVIVRAIGPSLPIAGALEIPTLELRNANGDSIRNDNWRTGGQEAEIIQSGVPPTNDFESALVETLSGNGASYTAIVRGVNNTAGIAVVEVYALN